jgi:hypothetical protein
MPRIRNTDSLAIRYRRHCHIAADAYAYAVRTGDDTAAEDAWKHNRVASMVLRYSERTYGYTLVG